MCSSDLGTAGTPVVLSAGTAIYSSSVLASGVHRVSAYYNGDVNFSASSSLDGSGALSITVVDAITIETSSPLPEGIAAKAYSTTFTGSGGTTPYSWSAKNLPDGLTLDRTTGDLSGASAAAGTFTITVTMTDKSGLDVSRDFLLLVNKVAPLISASVGSVAFAATSSGGPPPAQTFTITGGATPVQISAAISDSPGSIPAGSTRSASVPGLFYVNGGGMTPTSLTLEVDPLVYNTLPSGTYSASLGITGTSPSTTSTTNVPLSITVVAKPARLMVSPLLLQFTANAGTPGTQSASLSVINAGGGRVNFSASASGQLAVTLSSSNGATSSGLPSTVVVGVDSTGLAPGNYSASVSITSDAGAIVVPVDRKSTRLHSSH